MPRNRTRRPGSGGPKSPGTRAHGPRTRTRNPHASPGPEFLYGQHAVLEALANPRRTIRRFLASENAARRFEEQIRGTGRTPELVRTSEITGLTGPEAVHQGLLLEADPLPSPGLDRLVALPGPIVVLDRVTDPHNVGAVLRSCAAFAAAGLVTTARHSPGASAVLARAASGALEHVPVSKVANLARAIGELKDNGVVCIGLDGEGEDVLERAVRHPGRLALVLGAEGKGLRQGTRAACSMLARIDTGGAIRSLNVSNAAALALYIATRTQDGRE